MEGDDMDKTYTYTARSAINPAKTVTFTLHDHKMSVELGVPLEQIERVLRPAEQEEGDEQQIEFQAWLKPVAMALLQQGMRPFQVADVDAALEDGDLRISAWGRPGGLRLAPFVVAMERVDNLDAAKAFVEELTRRQASAAEPSVFPGPLDYWASWFIAGFSAALLTAGWLWRRRHRAA
jgi:hypothetical protein